MEDRLKNVAQNIVNIANSLHTMKDYDVICALGANRSLLNIYIKELENESYTS